jgi:UPF0755 protein
MKKYISIAVILFVVLMIAFIHYAVSPVNDLTVTQIIDIPQGSAFIESVDILEKAGLVKNRYMFYLLVLSKNSHIRAGKYELSTSMSPSEILDKLVRGENKSYLITIPDGFTVREIADRLAFYKIVDKKVFMDFTSNSKFLRSLKIQGDSVEGYLYPETYQFDRSTDSREIIKIMVEQFWKSITPEMYKRAGEIGMSFPEVITLASIICKYSGSKEEKAIISAVFHNRLKKGMALQSDPTAIYGLEREEKLVEKVREHYRKSDTPYNTYRITGLPPGPIANPDIDSLRAALYPAKVDYLYIVAKRDGVYKFSTNINP